MAPSTRPSPRPPSPPTFPPPLQPPPPQPLLPLRPAPSALAWCTCQPSSRWTSAMPCSTPDTVAARELAHAHPRMTAPARRSCPASSPAGHACGAGSKHASLEGHGLLGWLAGKAGPLPPCCGRGGFPASFPGWRGTRPRGTRPRGTRPARRAPHRDVAGEDFAGERAVEEAGQLGAQ
jgi:hypothetical protein